MAIEKMLRDAVERVLTKAALEAVKFFLREKLRAGHAMMRSGAQASASGFRASEFSKKRV
jgi:hypothetical protein